MRMSSSRHSGTDGAQFKSRCPPWQLAELAVSIGIRPSHPVQDSGPSRSLVFTRKALPSSTSCRLSGKAMALIGLRMMPTFPSPPLKFRTAGFPQYGFKAGISDKAFPKTRFVLRAHCCHRVLPALCQGRCAIRHLRASGPNRSTPGALAPVRVMLSRSILT